jgi:hypothetical protein
MQNGPKTIMSARQPRPAASFATRSKRWASSAARPEPKSSQNAQKTMSGIWRSLVMKPKSATRSGQRNKTDHKAQKKPRNLGGAEYAYAYINWQTPTNGGRPESLGATLRGKRPVLINLSSSGIRVCSKLTTFKLPRCKFAAQLMGKPADVRYGS